MNKDEILAIARRIETFDLSKVVGEYCALVPKKPATAASSEAIRAEESHLSSGLVERAVDQRSVLDLRSLDVKALEIPELETETISPGSTVIDLRPRAAFENWHYPDALSLDFANALRAYPHFSRDAHYVVYCEFGLQSAHLVEQMRREGFDALHFKGGAPALLRWQRKQL
jgi:thiamine biosynthesis protein ThiI